MQLVSILKLDYSRKEGEWEPNIYGSNGNIEAIEFIKDLNITLYQRFPDIQNYCRRVNRLAKSK